MDDGEETMTDVVGGHRGKTGGRKKQIQIQAVEKGPACSGWEDA